MIPALAAAVLFFAQAGAPAECEVLTLNANGGLDAHPVPGLAEALTTAGAPLPPRPAKAEGVQCARASIVPEANDDRIVTAYGVALFITVADGRMGLLERVDGRFLYTTPGSGADFSPDESAGIAARLDLFQQRTQP